jgi:hypothetical protein
MTMRRITQAASAAAVLLTSHGNAGCANAASVNRPLADELTRQFNQQELEQLQSAAGAGSQSGAEQLNRSRLDPMPAIPPSGISRTAVPPPPEWPYPPR